jgi:hypothetical protein
MPRRLLFTAISALLSAQVLTAGLSQNTSRDTSTPFRTVRGTVVASNTDSTPLRRVRVVVTGGTIVASPAYTDDFGRFQILVPAKTASALTFTKAGFAPHVTSPTVAAPASDLRIALAAGAAVMGRVTDQYGDPLVTRVHVRRMADEAGRSAQDDEWAADSDDLGEFRVGSLPAGRFEVRVVQPSAPGSGDAPRPSSGGPVFVDLRAGEETTLNFVEETQPADPRGRVIGSSRTPVLENGGAISGRVLGSDARAVGGAFVTLTAGIEGARETTTDPEGRYEFTGLPAGSYRVTAAKLGTALTMRGRPAEVTITDRPVLSGINVEMQRPSAVIGSVVDHFGEPMEGLTVELWRPVLSDGRRMLKRPEAVPPRRTDDRGLFRLFRVAAGEYYVTAGEEARSGRNTVEGPDSSLRVYYPGTSVVAEAVVVRVAPGLDAAGIHITHAPPTGGRVYGSAFDSRGQPLRFPVTLIRQFRARVFHGPCAMAPLVAVRLEQASWCRRRVPRTCAASGRLLGHRGRSSRGEGTAGRGGARGAGQIRPADHVVRGAALRSRSSARPAVAARVEGQHVRCTPPLDIRAREQRYCCMVVLPYGKDDLFAGRRDGPHAAHDCGTQAKAAERRRA